jgi:hypothetical protein
MFRESSVSPRLRGGVYRHGMRPKDSAAEDAVVRFLGGDYDRIHTGSVMISIYVPGVDVYGDGVVRCDNERCEDLEAALTEWLNSMTVIRQGYRLAPERIVSTEQEPGSGQFFVAARLKYCLIMF